MEKQQIKELKKGIFEKDNFPIIREDDFVEIEGEFYMTSETLGKILGFSNPRQAIYNIFERNIDELEEFSCVLNMRTGKRVVKTRFFSEEGIYLITMFAKTPKAKEFRKAVAKLLKKLRRQALLKARYEGARALESLYKRLEGGTKKYDKKWLEKLKKYISLGLSVEEISKLLDCHESTVSRYKKLLIDTGLISTTNTNTSTAS